MTQFSPSMVSARQPLPTFAARLLSDGRRLTTLLVCVWVLELSVLQALTLLPLELLSFAQTLKHLVRVTLNSFFVGALVVLLGRRLLHAIVVLQCLVLSGLVTYARYFGRPLSLVTALESTSEGLAVGDYVAKLALSWPCLVLVALALLKMALIEARARSGFRPDRRRLGPPLVVGYLLLPLAMHSSFHSMRRIRGFDAVGNMGLSYGYVWTWVAEAIYLQEEDLTQRAIARSQERSDRLSGVEAALPFGPKVVVLQVESLDYDVVGFRAEGQVVTPFLAELRKRSRYYKARALHPNGSADSDFVALTGLSPSPDIVNWKLRGFPIAQTLPRLARAQGYRVTSLHGAPGTFFNRRTAYAGLGFDAVLFREEMEQLGLPTSGWGVKDRQLLELSQRLLTQDPERSLQFLITLTSHGPFTELEPHEREIFPEARGELAEDYLNSVRYVDRALEAYVHGLPHGTTVILYGDHESRAGYQGPNVVRGTEFVPVLIHQVGTDLSLTQRTRGGLAESGELSLLDVFTYVHRQLGQARPAGGGAQASSAAMP